MNKLQIKVGVFLGLFLLICQYSLLAQTHVLKGKIINAIDGKAVVGETIGLKRTTFKSVTNTDGEFRLNVPDSLKTLDFDEIVGKELLEVKTLEDGSVVVYLSPSNLVDLSFEELFKIKVNVSSTKTETVFHTPSTVSIIDREMLNQYNFLSVAEMLRTAVGIDIYQTNNDDNVPTSRGVLQNFYANKILVMIENIPTYQPIYGNTNLDRLDVNDIERIEVLKGPASVLYGSNAYLGVVNIILRKGEDGDVNVRLATGYHRLGSAGANVTLSKKDFKLFLSGNSGYESQNPYPLLGKRQDLFHGDSIIQFQRQLNSANFNVVSSYKAFTVLLNNYEYQHTYLGVNPSYISGAGKPMTDRGTLLAIKYNQNFTPKVHFLADLTYDYFKRDYPTNESASEALVLSGERLVATTKLNYDAKKWLDCEFGIDAEGRLNGKHVAMDLLQDQVIRVNLKNASDITELSTFGQVHMKTKFVNVLGGLRYTFNSFSGDNFSSRVSAVTNISESNSIKIIFGQSFRAPTMLELFFDHPTVVGKRDLKPEKANSLELAYVHGKKYLFIQMLGYYHKLDHLIQRYTPPTGPPSSYQNLSGIEGCGIEFEAKYQNPKSVNAFFNYNFMDGLGTESRLNYRLVPRHTFKVGINKAFGQFFASANGYAVSSVMGNPKLNVPIPGQTMFDLHFGYKHTIPTKKLNLIHTLSMKNITNSDMLIPEYIRQTDNINSQATTEFGRRFIYTLQLSF